ncbi:MAG: hypothetical protein A2566_00080 [Candidatus Zambryskibacteria bacterium RIFOXYD1_FULL_40_13]|nr:MAG: hypothetical protein UT68_C0006G0052 [Parcubacteria group bacterium GW2011_GWC2_40_10]KKR64909.1 MAG: hypothetical protein UU06_C0035G0006 [Parcubacteria group bacterium GW2011_GWB1_40_5]KKR69058.1 MAG: hypothetical protein UU11_C0003G0052 [Parcubacteria group bacterium GW2011_GWF2_40_69]KKR81640.1 MAG: hypothetical protein UU27_C0012G0015 [Parcubacteria group bacterium GW2011_GWD1_40_9]OHA88340.1 MAG: hypothetical protein A2123_00055 [Candidatus Zambryskibacteria bacterium GWB1_40_5]O
MQLSQYLGPILPDFVTSFLAGIPVFLIILVIFFIMYCIVSVILIYHWTQYGMKSVTVLFAETLFVFVSLFLFTLSFMSLNYL